MPTAPEQVRAAKQTTLQRTITTALNELDAEVALVGIVEHADGPLILQGMRGFTSREAQAILRALSTQEAAALAETRRTEEGEPRQALRLRLITPAARSFLAIPLRHKQRAYGVLVVGRKEGGAYSKKDKGLLESAGDEMTTALDRAALFDGTVLLQRPYVTQEPLPANEPQGMETQSVTASYATPAMQEQVAALLDEAQSTLSFDRAWVCAYDPVAGAVEVVGSTGEGKTEQKADHKREMKAIQRLPLDSSASGWAVRHRKPRVDQDLAPRARTIRYPPQRMANPIHEFRFKPPTIQPGSSRRLNPAFLSPSGTQLHRCGISQWCKLRPAAGPFVLQ